MINIKENYYNIHQTSNYYHPDKPLVEDINFLIYQVDNRININNIYYQNRFYKYLMINITINNSYYIHHNL